MSFRQHPLRAIIGVVAAVIAIATAGCTADEPSYAAWAVTEFGISPDESFTVQTRTPATNQRPEWGFTFLAGALAETNRHVSFDFVTDDNEVYHLWTEREKITVRPSQDSRAMGVLKFDASPTNSWNTPPLDRQNLGYYVGNGLSEIVLTVPPAMEAALRQP